jgi:hypothetical protein
VPAGFKVFALHQTAESEIFKRVVHLVLHRIHTLLFYGYIKYGRVEVMVIKLDSAIALNAMLSFQRFTSLPVQISMSPGCFQHLLRACPYTPAFKSRLGFNGFIAVDLQVDYRAVNINPKLYLRL